MDKIIICGAGGLAREVYSWIKDTHYVAAFYSESIEGPDTIYNIPVISNFSIYDGHYFVAAIGNPIDRKSVCDGAQRHGLVLASAIIHKTAVVGHNNIIGPGTIICPNAVITNDVYLGKSVIVNLGATIGHDTKIYDYVTVSPGANISGNVEIGEMSYVGTNASIKQKCTVGHESVVGMGAAVLNNIPSKECWVGVPAKKV